MNSAFAKVSNLKFNRASKIAITIASSTFFLYAFGQAPIFKSILTGAFSCSGYTKYCFLRETKKLK